MIASRSTKWVLARPGEGHIAYTCEYLDKNALVFNLMMRQPDFVTEDFANEMIERTKKKKPHNLLDKVEFTIIEEGLCVQMLHKGSYDSEPEKLKTVLRFQVT
jgi:hypothetical protein